MKFIGDWKPREKKDKRNQFKKYSSLVEEHLHHNSFFIKNVKERDLIILSQTIDNRECDLMYIFQRGKIDLFHIFYKDKNK